MPDFPVIEAKLVSLFTEAAFFGISIATYIECLRSLVGNGENFRATSPVRKALLVVATLMFIISAVDIALLLRQILHAFVDYDGADGATGAFETIANKLNVARGTTLPIQTILGDGILIFRTWVIWNRRWWTIVFPVLLLIGDAISGFGVAYTESRLVSGQITDTDISPWATSFTAVTLGLNLICTTLIVSRLWLISRRSRDIRISHIRPLEQATRLVLESGALYSLASLALLLTNVTRSNAIYPVSDALVPFIAILFDVVILRVSWLRSAGFSQPPASSPRATGTLSGATERRQSYSFAVPLSSHSQGGVVSVPLTPLDVVVHRDMRLPSDGAPSIENGKHAYDKAWMP